MFFGNSGDRMITLRLIMRRAAALGAFTFAAASLSSPSAAQNLNSEAAEAAAEPLAAEAPAPLSAAAEALRAELVRRLGDRSPVIDVYAGRGFKPLWLDEVGAANGNATALLGALAKAGSHALPTERYDASGLATRMEAGGNALEADLTAAFLTYARDITSGALEPRSVDRELHVYPERPDPAALIAAAADATDMAAFLESLQPANPLYSRLVARYAVFRSRADGDIWGSQVPTGRTLRPGDRHHAAPW